jgi:hypothetical protein
MSHAPGNVLRIGGNAVHRVAPRKPNEAATPPTSDQIPIIERYQDLAAAIHKTAIAPRADLFIWGCLCGAAGVVREPGLRQAELVALKHVLDEAQNLHDTLEGDPQ